MKISTKGRYGLRAILDLAVHSNGNQVSLYSIAEREKISVNYLEQVFSTLRKAGIVRSVKGAQGGYILADQPSKIKVGTLLRCLEGSLNIADEDTAGENAGPIQSLIQKCIWDKVNKSINSIVDSITLEDILEEYKNVNMQPMFYI